MNRATPTQFVDTDLFRKASPENWNRVWQIIKADKPDYAVGLQDPALADLISHFSGTAQLYLDDIPQRAHDLIPQSVIVTH